MANSNQQPQGNTQWQPPTYKQACNDPSQTGYPDYPQGYPQTPAAYPPHKGYAETAGYNQAQYPIQGYPQGGGYTNYAQQPYYPPPAPAASSNNQSVVVTQNTLNTVVQPVKNYLALAILALFMFLPTGIVAVLKANEAQQQYHMGNIDRAQACNSSAKKFIIISVVLGVVSIIIAVVLVVVVFNANFYYASNIYNGIKSAANDGFSLGTK